MIAVHIEESTTQLQNLLEQVATGEEIIIYKQGKPVAKLIQAEKPRRFHFGRDAGKGWIADDSMRLCPMIYKPILRGVASEVIDRYANY